MIIIFGSTVLSLVSVVPNFTYAIGRSPAIQCHGDDNIPLFVPFFNIPMSLSYLFQRIASVDDRFYLPRLNQRGEEDQVFDLLPGRSQTRRDKLYLFAAAAFGHNAWSIIAGVGTVAR